jgi:hypothetical protein
MLLDYPTDRNTPMRIDVYIKGEQNGLDVNLGEGPIMTTTPTTPRISISIEEISKRMKLANYTGPVKIGTALWFQEKNTDGSNKKVSSHTEWLMVKWDENISSNLLSNLALTPEHAEKLNAIFSNPNYNELAEGSKEIINYIKSIVISEHQLRYDQIDASRFEFEGKLRGTGDLECKAWLQEIIKIATQGTKIPTNVTMDSSGKGITAYAWNMLTTNNEGKILSSDGKVEEITKIRGESSFRSMIDPDNQNRLVKSGDIVQMAYGYTPHTMVILKIENDGMWVCDTNFEFAVPALPDESHSATGIEENGKFRSLTAQEIQAGVQPTHWLKSDNTVRIHFMTYKMLDDKARMATIYRANV